MKPRNLLKLLPFSGSSSPPSGTPPPNQTSDQDSQGPSWFGLCLPFHTVPCQFPFLFSDTELLPFPHLPKFSLACVLCGLSTHPEETVLVTTGIASSSELALIPPQLKSVSPTPIFPQNCVLTPLIVLATPVIAYFLVCEIQSSTVFSITVSLVLSTVYGPKGSCNWWIKNLINQLFRLHRKLQL